MRGLTPGLKSTGLCITFPSPLSQNSDHSFYPTFHCFNLQFNDAVSIVGGGQTGMGKQQRTQSMNERQTPATFLCGTEGNGSAEMRNTPQLDCTKSDIYQDELYNPESMHNTPAPLSHARTSLASQGSLLSWSLPCFAKSRDIRTSEAVQTSAGHEYDMKSLQFFPNSQAFGTSPEDATCQVERC